VDAYGFHNFQGDLHSAGAAIVIFHLPIATIIPLTTRNPSVIGAGSTTSGFIKLPHGRLLCVPHKASLRSSSSRRFLVMSAPVAPAAITARAARSGRGGRRSPSNHTMACAGARRTNGESARPFSSLTSLQPAGPDCGAGSRRFTITARDHFGAGAGVAPAE
jgi:hypothetical protein